MGLGHKFNMLLAQDLDTIQTKGLPGFRFNAPGAQQPARVISVILPYVFGAAALALLIYLVLGGLQMMTSRGDPKAIQSAQGKITNAIIGFIIVAFAYLIVQILGQILGVGVFESIFK